MPQATVAIPNNQGYAARQADTDVSAQPAELMARCGIPIPQHCRISELHANHAQSDWILDQLWTDRQVTIQAIHFVRVHQIISVHHCSLAVTILLAVLAQSLARAESVDPSVRAFLTNYCVKCHGPDEQEADFRVDRLRVSESVGDAEYWQLVSDNLHLGEMPPEDEKQPSEEERDKVTSWIEAELRRARRVLSGESGEVVLRRLNRTEYEYTIEDLFGVRGDYADGFPADATAESFDNNGAALMLSSEQITQYIQAADHILNRSIQTGSRPETRRSVFTLHDFNRESWKRHREQLEKRLKTFDELTPNEQQRTRDMQKALEQNPHDGFSFPVWEDGKLRVPTPEDGPEVDAVIAIKATYGAPDTRRAFSARHAGWYRFKIVAYAAKSDGQPVRLKINYGSFRQGTIPKVADVLYLTEPEPKQYEYRLYLQPNEIVKLQMIDGTNWARREDQIELPGPFVAIRQMEMEGPLFDQWPPAGHRTLLGTRDASSLSDEEMPAVLEELAAAVVPSIGERIDRARIPGVLCSCPSPERNAAGSIQADGESDDGVATLSLPRRTGGASFQRARAWW